MSSHRIEADSGPKNSNARAANPGEATDRNDSTDHSSDSPECKPAANEGGNAVALVPVLDRYASGWPMTPDSFAEHGLPKDADLVTQENALRSVPKNTVTYVNWVTALATPYTYDAHVVAYSCPSQQLRLTKGAAALIDVRAVLALFDVDHPDKKPTPAWRAAERLKVQALRAVHPELVAYDTNGGYRLAGARPGEGVPVDDSWSDRYLAELDYLKVRFGIVADKNCADWPRLFRLPRVRRDGRSTHATEIVADGWDPAKAWDPPIGPIVPKPTVRPQGQPTTRRQGAAPSEAAVAELVEAMRRAGPPKQGGAFVVFCLANILARGDWPDEAIVEAVERMAQAIGRKAGDGARGAGQALARLEAGGGGYGRTKLTEIYSASSSLNDVSNPADVIIKAIERVAPPIAENATPRADEAPKVHVCISDGSIKKAATSLQRSKASRTAGDLLLALAECKPLDANAIPVATKALRSEFPDASDESIKAVLERNAAQHHDREAFDAAVSAGLAPAPTAVRAADGRDDILITDDLRAMLDATERGLAKRGDVFGWQGQLCQARRGKLTPLTHTNLAVLSSEANSWGSWDEKHDCLAPRRPDDLVVEAVRTRGVWDHIQQINGIVSAPVWLRDGRVLCAPGHDAASGLFYDGPAFAGELLSAPTNELLAELLDPIAEFPWPADVPGAKTAALAYLFSLLMQYGYEAPTPWFMFSADRQRGGKGLLARALTHVAFGRDEPISPWPSSDEELGKNVVGILEDGSTRAVLFDEPGRTVGGPKLRAIATAPEYRDRKLGVNRRIGGANNIVWAMLGNKLRLGDDMARRAAVVPLGVQERTEFKYADLLGHISAKRGRLLNCAFTLITRWVEAARPGPKAAPMPSFEAWSRNVEGLLDWLALPSFRANVDVLEDAQADEADAVFRIVEGVCADVKNAAGVQASDILQHAGPRSIQAGMFAEWWDTAFGHDAGTKRIAQKLRSTQPTKDGTRLVLHKVDKRWRVERPKQPSSG